MTDPYRPRRTESLGVAERAGWSIKLIGITAGGDLPGAADVDAVLRAAERELPSGTGVAFLIVHRGTEALWGILGWWALDILYHRVFRADLDTTAVRPVPPDGPTACVWELLAIDHERRAWVDNVLRRPDDPDLAGYLAARVT